MTTHEDQFADECMQIVNQIDVKVTESGDEELMGQWSDGDLDGAYDKLKQMFPEVTEDQWDWIEDFVSEI